jgi:hypothetical protein
VNKVVFDKAYVLATRPVVDYSAHHSKVKG